MPWRRTRIALAIFSFIWFGIILPGHRRGILVFDHGKTCCDCCCGSTNNSDHSQSPGNPGAHCEICNFAAHLNLPPVVDFAPPLLCLAVGADSPAPSLAPLLRLQFVRQDRAPPFVA